MNREIIFKAKRVDNGEWVEGYYVKGSTRHCIMPSLAPYSIENWEELSKVQKINQQKN